MKARARGDIRDTADHWRPADPELADAARMLAEAAAGVVHEIAACCDDTDVDTIPLLGCDVYSALHTQEHTDEGFPRWTVLLVLRTRGHSLTVNDGAARFVPEEGDLLLFDLHAPHVLDLPEEAWPADERMWRSASHLAELCKDYPFVCAHVDVERQPSRAEAEALMLESLAPAIRLSAVPAP